ncbi:DedA family protein [Paenibacillus sp. GCM10023252]|uniref:DedA family protein n=1 Tax=Paenibacillus sp. GCM10023252 TaxID=3252649 RepID=UPI0036221057
MGYDFLLGAIDEIGYIAFFLALCLGLIGLPIPNEVVIMTGGALAASGVMDPIPAYISTFLGICSAMSFNYVIGRFAGKHLFERLNRKKNMDKFLDTSNRLSERYGGYAISISLCLPVLRHVTPYVLGMNKLQFLRFARFAYPSAFIWTMIYFLVGSYVGDNIQHIGDYIYKYGVIIALILVLGLALYAGARFMRIRKEKNDIHM